MIDIDLKKSPVVMNNKTISNILDGESSSYSLVCLDSLKSIVEKNIRKNLTKRRKS
jgi:hypothetical protein